MVRERGAEIDEERPRTQTGEPPTCAKNGTTEDEFGVDVSWIRAIKFVSESGSVALFFDEHDACDRVVLQTFVRGGVGFVCVGPPHRPPGGAR